MLIGPMPLRQVPGTVAEPEPQGAGTFAGAIIIIQFSAPAPTPALAPSYKLGIIKSSERREVNFKEKKITNIIEIYVQDFEGFDS